MIVSGNTRNLLDTVPYACDKGQCLADQFDEHLVLMQRQATRLHTSDYPIPPPTVDKDGDEDGDSGGDGGSSGKGSRRRKKKPDTTTAAPTVPFGECSQNDAKLSFSQATLTRNNLGNLGPDEIRPWSGESEHVLQLRGVGTLGGQSLDLIISNTSKYDRASAWVPAKENTHFLSVNVLGGHSVDLNFAFVFSETQKPAELDEVHFTIMDLDKSKKGKLHEKISVPGLSSYVIAPDAEVNVSSDTSGRTIFEATKFGPGCDNPKDPMDLTSVTCSDRPNKNDPSLTDQKKRSAMMIFKDVSNFDLTLDVPCQKNCQSGRNFLFAWNSELSKACVPVGECSRDKKNIDFSNAVVGANNLGNHGPEPGPDQVLQLKGVATVDDQAVDLVISNTSKYERFSVPGKINKHFVGINVLGGTSVDLKFKFVKAELDKIGDTPIKLDEVHFTIMDLDRSKKGKYNETISVSGLSSYVVAPDAEFKVSHDRSGRTTFEATKYGPGCDNPKDPMKLITDWCFDKDMDNITTDQMKRSAMMVFKDVSEFSLTLNVDCEKDCKRGRNFLFAWTSQLSNACSVPVGKCSRVKKNLNFAGASVVDNNLGNLGPDNGEDVLQLRGVGTLGGQSLDLVISNISNYARDGLATPGKLNRNFVSINVLGGHSVDLNFAFVFSETQKRAELDEVHFTIMDLDRSKYGKLHEKITVSGLSSYVVAPDAEVMVSTEFSGETTFEATTFGPGCDNPLDPMELVETFCQHNGEEIHTDQKKRSAMMVFKDVSDFKLKLDVPCDGECKRGRNFLFTWTSQLAELCDDDGYSLS
jgi:hypothetical protein